MKLTDRLQAATMHATARWTIRYGEELRFAGTELPAPQVVEVDTGHGQVPVHVYGQGTTAHVGLLSSGLPAQFAVGPRVPAGQQPGGRRRGVRAAEQNSP